MTWEQWQQALASRTHPRRLMTFEEMAEVAAFVVSGPGERDDRTIVNLTMEALDDEGRGTMTDQDRDEGRGTPHARSC